MKIRNGFVSNSSSSSFVLRVPKNRLLRLNEIKEWFDIKDDDWMKTDIAIILLWIIDYASFNSESEFPILSEDTLIDAGELLDWYSQYSEGSRLEEIQKMLSELDRDDLDTKIIAFEADDNEGNLVNYDFTELFSRILVELRRNAVAFNEH